MNGRHIWHPETEGIKGTGLGRYIVKGLVDLWQGEVWAESELDRGSPFFFSLLLRQGKVVGRLGGTFSPLPLGGPLLLTSESTR